MKQAEGGTPTIRTICVGVTHLPTDVVVVVADSVRITCVLVGFTYAMFER
jgi:hypothetical protein